MPKRKREPLSAERIEVSALELIEEEGLESFSTRKLAARLSCEAMSIYHYFPSKAHLMDAVFDRVLAGLPEPDPDLPWRARVRQSLLEYRAMAHRYPRFFQFVALHRHNTRVGLALLESILKLVREGGLDTEEAARYFRAMSYYVVGAALDETSGYAKGPSAVEPVSDEEVMRDFPEVAAVNPYFKPAERQKTFDLGLDVLLDSLEQMASAAKRRTSGRRSRPPRIASVLGER
jgi:AcrR family transcriptional regulator